MTYTVKDLINRFSVTEHTVLHWINSGELEAMNVGVSPGKRKPRWRITEAALASFELRRSTSPPPARAKRKRKPTTNVIDRY